MLPGLSGTSGVYFSGRWWLAGGVCRELCDVPQDAAWGPRGPFSPLGMDLIRVRIGELPINGRADITLWVQQKTISIQAECANGHMFGFDADGSHLYDLGIVTMGP